MTAAKVRKKEVDKWMFSSMYLMKPAVLLKPALIFQYKRFSRFFIDKNHH